MGTLLYSPGVRVVIQTAGHGIVDVSEDIQSGSVSIVENASASLSLTLVNHRRKYDGIFTPNDLVSVQLKRLRWLPVFAGYLNQVPYFSVYPRNIQITASDTLKRLKYRLWDPGAPASYELLNSDGGGADGAGQIDGGLRDRIINVMTEVADWPAQNIHIGRLPDDWSDRMNALREKLADEWAIDPAMLGSSGVAGGMNPAQAGSGTVANDGPGTGVIPTARAKARTFGGSGSGTMHLTGESINSPADKWYLAMRWPYAVHSSNGTVPGPNLDAAQFERAKNWWRNRKILVVNPKNNRAVTLRAAHWGPTSASGRSMSMSKHALETVLRAKDGDTLEVRFAPLNAELGATTIEQGSAAPGGSAPPTTTPSTIQAASGIRFTAADSLRPNCAAARSFIKANWHIPHGIGGYANRNIGGTSKKSDHALGLALDVMVATPGTRAAGADEAKGNAVAMWFVANPNVFATKYVIWMDRINSGSGWRTYGHPTKSGGHTVQHRDHVHISFKSTNMTSPGSMGSGFPGGSPADFNNNVTAGNGADPGAGGSGDNLINAFNWNPRPDPQSSMLHGPRALLNDSPVLQTLSTLCQASMRSYMAAPNGDFIAWFPDYFGTYGTAGRLIVKDIELAGDGFTMTWSDEHLVTHQFTAGSASGYSQGAAPVQGAGAVDIFRQIQTNGIATVEFPEIMEALFNVDRNDPRSKNFLDPEAILQRFGARVDYQPMGQITGGEAEFWYACHLFQKNWASQFSASVSLTFMPEAWPGMLLRLETFGLQAYIERVTHRFNFADGGGFTTEVNVIAPSAISGTGLYALPRADGHVVRKNNPVAGEHTYGWGGSVTTKGGRIAR